MKKVNFPNVDINLYEKNLSTLQDDLDHQVIQLTPK